MDYDILVNLGVQFVTLGTFGGIIWTRLSQLEKADEELKLEVRDFREMKQELAVIKSQLVSISACLNRLAENYDKRQADALHA
jgi:hypothetical protein